ncbi:MAG TPA: hypothetical protein VGW14_00780 [Thermoleophilaceae bacterium]|nr:hypothetical protein [Thermoleophilaceae bacterium]
MHARPDFGRDSSPWPQERLLVEGGRTPTQREQLAAAAQAGERDGDVERPVLSEFAASASWMTSSGEKKSRRPWS